MPQLPDTRTLEQRLPITVGELGFREHSKKSSAKKIVEVYPFVAPHDITPGVTIDPIQSVAANGPLALTAGKAYRIISDGSLRFKLSIGAVAAVATDIYLPADTPIIIKMDTYNTFNFIQTGGTFVQAVEVA